jgi:hypothetical protein
VKPRQYLAFSGDLNLKQLEAVQRWTAAQEYGGDETGSL